MAEVEYLNLLAKYKFVIAIENAVCDDYVTEKLWRSLQVGAVPIYLGAPNIEEYLPHPRAAVLVKDFGSVREVAEEVLRLHGDDTQYWRHLAHKQLHARGELVPNKLLGEMLAARKWGVTNKQQHDKGNFVKHFQCLVCERVANNVWFSDLGEFVITSVD
jgi:alpha-1,3-fucosyltransferase 10